MWGERYARIPYKGGTYEESVFQPFKKITSLEEAKTLSIPTPDDFDLSHVNSLCKKHDDYALITGHSGYLDFMNAIACYRVLNKYIWMLRLVKRCLSVFG